MSSPAIWSEAAPRLAQMWKRPRLPLQKADFKNKMHIAEKEAKEAHCRLRLLKDSELMPFNEAEKLLAPCEELKRILAAITKTVSRSNIPH